MSYISRNEAQSSYRPKAGLMSPGLKRAREPYRARNALTGLLLGSFAVGIWAWSISAVKQDVFDDVDEEARELMKARENANVGSAATAASPAPAPASAGSGSASGTTGVLTIGGSVSSNAKGRVDEAGSLALSSSDSKPPTPASSTPPSSNSSGWFSWFSKGR